jgi:hypothetical protein
VTSDKPVPRLSGEQIQALKFAAHRQLARWSNKAKLSPHQHGQRSTLKSAVRVLQDETFAAAACLCWRGPYKCQLEVA